jgi:hypothetical protein
MLNIMRNRYKVELHYRQLKTEFDMKKAGIQSDTAMLYKRFIAFFCKI